MDPGKAQEKRIKSEEEEILTFHFQTFCLWKLDAEYFVREHIVSMYALLPTMRGANAELLHQAIDEMGQRYQGNETALANQLKWLGILLRRAEMLSPEDKQEIQERLNMWDNLLENDPVIQKKIAQGEARGEIIASQKMVLQFVEVRFPPLLNLAKQRVKKIKEADTLRQLALQIGTAPDEAAARQILDTYAA